MRHLLKRGESSLKSEFGILIVRTPLLTRYFCKTKNSFEFAFPFLRKPVSMAGSSLQIGYT